ncbi:MAG: hypothetical protein LBH92_05700 [Bacteroidales bacterium]|nr:hypothetical protein [Bacteroidales bacterium]
MAEFVGTFDCKMDSKGRLNIPVKIRENIADGSETLICRKSFNEPCLELFSKTTWALETRFLKDLDTLDKEDMNLKRQFLQDVKIDTWDSTGRFLIPKNLLEFAGIDKDVVIVGLDDSAEVWDKEKYLEKMRETSEKEKADMLDKIRALKRKSINK